MTTVCQELFRNFLYFEQIIFQVHPCSWFKAKVFRIESFGAFVKFGDQEALLHISDLSDKRVEKVEDVIKMNDDIEVAIKEVDSKKRIKVKIKAHRLRSMGLLFLNEES